MYGKVFSSMYDGTLATKGPWQALITFQQMIVLADRDGVVDMTASAISRRTSIPLDIIELGITELMQPDPESRTAAEDGRRIVLLEGHRTWGWQVVNYAKYAALRSAEERREYMRVAQAEHRARKKAEASKIVMTSQDKSANVKESTDVPVDVPVDADKPTENTNTPRKRGSAGDVGFERFWAAYPRKTAKANAQRAWEKLAPSADLLDDIVAAVKAQSTWPAWCKDDGQFIPHAATWLNGARWADVEPVIRSAPFESDRARAARESVEAMTGGLVSAKPQRAAQRQEPNHVRDILSLD
jgi:hypothetical protein